MPLQCWRWNAKEDWPPFVAHKDVYELDPRCVQARASGDDFALTRRVRWEGDFRQSELATDRYDPFYGNNNSCTALNNYNADAVQLHDARYCSDGSLRAYSTKANDVGDCPRGTHVGACGLHADLVRTQRLKNFSLVMDELQQPTGPPFQDCFDPDVADYECCRASHAFAVGGADNDACFDKTVNECDPQQTEHFQTSTGCEAFCAAAFRREGNNDTCMPDVPECNNWVAPEAWPRDEPVVVTTQCICGPRLESLIDAGTYTQRGTEGWAATAAEANGVGGAYGRRRAADDAAGDASWRWPDPLAQGIRPVHGAHFDVPDPLYEAIMAFRTDLVPANATCANYLDLLAPPIASWDPAHPQAANGAHNLSSCDAGAENPGACCVAHRGQKPMSRVWLQRDTLDDRSVASAFTEDVPVGTAVHQSKVAAVGNFDGDDYPDVLIGNRLFTSTSGHGADVSDRFAYRAGVQVRPKDFAQVYAGDVNGDEYDDVVAVYDDGAFEIFLTLNVSGHVGFHSMGVQTLLVGHTITTVNFVGTLFGYGTDCRGTDWGCASSAQRAVFVGTEDTDDYVWVSPTPLESDAASPSVVHDAGRGATKMDFSVVFTPLANTKHRTLSSARFYPSNDMRHQALVIGTGSESPNSIAYLGTPGFEERPVMDQMDSYDESVGVAAARIAPSVNLICFANHGTKNRCHRFELDWEWVRQNRYMRLDYHAKPSSPRPPPPPEPLSLIHI
mgnify:FL=1